MKRTPLPPRTRNGRIIAVLRAPHATEYAPVIRALVAGGITSVELTLTTPGTFEHFGKLLSEFGAHIDLGIGTITGVDQVEAAAEAGASYIVTPVTDREVLKAAANASLAILPGGLTPTELHTGWTQGAAAVKIFPATTVGSGYLAQLRGPFPDLLAIPSGGVDLAAAEEWLRAGAAAVSVGGPLTGDAFKGGNLEELTARARSYVEAEEKARLQ
ncbi:MAG: 2-dehydro-3-deoxyphosphogluconate aldolase [Arthrobacter sp.]|nr:2-dehydro-3-deoxyphosphogluconate aldolase [Arthrobacter sp.]